MSVIVTIDHRDAATPSLQRLKGAMKRPEIRSAIGGAVRRDLRNYFRKLDQERPNRLGGRRTNFYGRAVQAVQMPEITAEGVRVGINHVGLRQRYLGGTIVPRAARSLTIPVHPLAYGRRAREFDDLEYVRTRAGEGVLIRPGAEGEEGEVFYALKRRVTQRPDPTVLPRMDDLSRSALAAANDQAAIILERERRTR